MQKAQERIDWGTTDLRKRAAPITTLPVWTPRGIGSCTSNPSTVSAPSPVVGRPSEGEGPARRTQGKAGWTGGPYRPERHDAAAQGQPSRAPAIASAGVGGNTRKASCFRPANITPHANPSGGCVGTINQVLEWNVWRLTPSAWAHKETWGLPTPPPGLIPFLNPTAVRGRSDAHQSGGTVAR